MRDRAPLRGQIPNHYPSRLDGYNVTLYHLRTEARKRRLALPGEFQRDQAPVTPPDGDHLAEKIGIDARLEALYQERADAVTTALRREFGDGPPDPEDITHQAFHKLIERGRWDDIENLPGFFWRTARNLLLTCRRNVAARRKHDAHVEQVFFAPQGRDKSPESVISVREQLRIVERTLRDMPPRRRDAFLMHRVEGLTLTETGKRLGVTRHAIVKHIARASVDIENAIAENAKGES